MATTRFIDIKVRTGDSKAEVKDLDGEMKDLGSTSDKAASSIDKLNSEAKGLGATLNKTAATANNLDRSTAKLTKTAAGVKQGIGGVGRSAGQAGIQLQQFIGQVQGGQSAMVALSQQSADLGFVLGAPLVGAVVGIGASVIGMASAMSTTKIEVLDLTEAVDGLEKRFDKLNKTQQELARRAASIEIRKQRKEAVALQNEVNELETAFINARRSANGRVLERLFGADPEEAEEALIQARASLVLLNQEIAENQKLLRADFKPEEEKEDKGPGAAQQRRSAIFVKNLALETQQFQAALALRQAATDGFITEQQAKLSTAFVNKQLQSDAQLQIELERLGTDEEAKEALRLQFNESRIASEELFQQQLIDLEANAAAERAQNEVNANNLVVASKQQSQQALLGLFASFAGKSKVAALALLAVSKGLAIAQTISGSLAGAAKVYGELPYPAAVVASGQILAQGKITAGLIAATGLVQGASVLSGGSSVSTSTSIGGGASINTGTQPTAQTIQNNQTRVIDIRTDGSAFGLAVAEATKSVLESDDSVVVAITESQQELQRVGG